jgi:uncharacterized protein with GYD domain
MPTYISLLRYTQQGIGAIKQGSLALALGAQGNIRTETLRAFTESEYRRIVSELA